MYICILSPEKAVLLQALKETSPKLYMDFLNLCYMKLIKIKMSIIKLRVVQS
jgi:hypothetical protein